MTTRTTPDQRLAALLDPERMPARVDRSSGYLDLLADTPPESSGRGQDLMLSQFYPRVYGWWRPFATRFALAKLDLGRAGERELARRMLDLSAGQTVLDLACGPGNFTGWFSSVVGPDGLAVGVDASPTMLGQAVRDHAGGVYLRADAERLPFRDDSFPAVCCFAALFLMAEPMRAVDEIARVLAPGGRVAIMTSCGGRTPVSRVIERAASAIGQVHVFGRDEITGALADRGLVDVRQRVFGIAQFVSARVPS